MLTCAAKWCLQSHLSTQDEYSARRGLRRTRKFRNYTYFFRFPASILVHSINLVFDFFARPFRQTGYHRQKSLYWTKHITYYRLPGRRPTMPTFSPYAKSAPTFQEFQKGPRKTIDGDIDVDFDPDASSSMMIPLILVPPSPAASGPRPTHSPSMPLLPRQRSDTAGSQGSYFPPPTGVSASSVSVSSRASGELPGYPESQIPLQSWSFNQPYNVLQQSQHALGIMLPDRNGPNPPPSTSDSSIPTAPLASPPAAPLQMESLEVRHPRRRSRPRSPSVP
jgi:hypothetical protein